MAPVVISIISNAAGRQHLPSKVYQRRKTNGRTESFASLSPARERCGPTATVSTRPVAAVELSRNLSFNVQGQGRCAALSRSVPCTEGLDRRSRDGLLKNFERRLLHGSNCLLCFNDSFCTFKQISQAVTITRSLEIADDTFELFVIGLTESLDRRV